MFVYVDVYIYYSETASSSPAKGRNFDQCSTCTHTHTHIHTYIHTYKHTYIHAYRGAILHEDDLFNELQEGIHTYTYIHTYIHTYRGAIINEDDLFIYTRIYIDFIKHTYIHTYIQRSHNK